jgi:hypothetical protein
MQYDLILSIIGIIWLVFRIWLPFYKVKDELEFRQMYISRFTNLFAACMLIAGGEAVFLNCLLFASFPAIAILTLIYDIPFYTKFSKRSYWKKNKYWVLLERITLHPPVLAVQIWMVVKGIFNFISPGDYISFIICTLLMIITTLLFDPRIIKRYHWPRGLHLILVIIGSCVFISIYIFWPVYLT